MLRLNRILPLRYRNPNGFSLIELMVAVAILALAVFGIFQAYSAGFMGMADARDRTVATNYMREAMENVRNMDFEEIATTTRSVTDGNKKYIIDVNLVESTETFKKIYTVVSWKDRNGETRTVNSSLTVNFIEVYASDAAKIVLFAESYAILNTPTTSPEASTEVIAVIKDINGNTVTDWDEGDITFQNVSSPTAYGEFPGGFSIDVTPIEGRASTTFTSMGIYNAATAPTDDYFVLQEIRASVYLPDEAKTVTDTMTIKISDGPVKIIVDANPKSVLADPTNYSVITASVQNAAGVILNKNQIFNDLEITFNAYDEGRFENNSTTYTASIPYDSSTGTGNEPAIVTVNLYSTGIPAMVNVLVTSPNLESGSTSVTFIGEPVAISISADPNPIYEDDADGSEIKVVLLDSNNYITSPIDSSITVTLVGTDNGTGGSIALSTLTFNISDMEKTTTFVGQNSTGTYSIDASSDGLTGASVTINVISSLVPHHIKLEVVGDDNIPADGISTAIIRTTVCDESGKTVTTYNGTITFETTKGIFTNNGSNLFVASTINGVAMADLTAISGDSGTATVTVSSSDSLTSDPIDGVEVKFYGTADHIQLNANPNMVKADGTDYSTITATVCDINGSTVTNYSGSISFYTTLGTFNSSATKEITDGTAIINLSYDEKGTAIVTVSDTLPNEPDPAEGVTVNFYEETTITLVENTTHYEDIEKKIIYFDIRVLGENILLNTIKTVWTNSHPNQKLTSVMIEDTEVYTGNIVSGVTVDINESTLLPSIDITIKLTFSVSMTDKFPIDVYFNPGPNQYNVTLFTSPS